MATLKLTRPNTLRKGDLVVRQFYRAAMLKATGVWDARLSDATGLGEVWFELATLAGEPIWEREAALLSADYQIFPIGEQVDAALAALVEASSSLQAVA